MDKISPQMENAKLTTFGEYIRTLREQAELSLRSVAADLNIDPSLLGKVERNERQPTKDFIKQVALFYKIHENTLMKEYLSDQIAYSILDEEEGLDILKVAEEKVPYLKTKRNG
ncbi:MAG: helix-turn-helix transcriptional regulator [Chitinophagaceae bacterium]